jgi:hypothetical protein
MADDTAMTPREMVAQAKATGRLEELQPLIAAEPVRPMSPAEAVRFHYTEYREAAGLGIAGARSPRRPRMVWSPPGETVRSCR